MSRLGALSVPPGDGDQWESLTQQIDPPIIPDEDYERQTDSNLLFDDPDGFSEKLAILQEAGVRNVIVWMGVGGVAQAHVLQSMRLFSEQVRPRFV